MLETRLHLSPAAGWVNDPNGLCIFRGYYHVFYQLDTTWPTPGGVKYWGHFRSRDFVNWEELDTALVPTLPEDRDGVYSGCAFIQKNAASDGGDLMRIYYTGNVVYEGDRVLTGMDANQILVTSEDGVHFGEKKILLRPEDYPASISRHVRDPKVWEQDGRYYMVLGTRRKDGAGAVLLYESDDLDSWRFLRQVDSEKPFGYMWECPNIAQVDGHDFLAVCPQGLPSEPTRWQNLWQSGYFPLPKRLIETSTVDETTFVEFDRGFDFYAPQIFSDAIGRSILVGWMGTFDRSYNSAPDGLGWCHCLTVPRRLTLDEDGLLRQWPIVEIEAMRSFSQPVDPHAGAILPHHLADIVIEGIRGDFSMKLDDGLHLFYKAADGLVTLEFTDEKLGAGRTSRCWPCPGGVDALRVLVDGSTVEVYVNHGEAVFSTRWFPTAETLLVFLDMDCESAKAWEMDAPQIARVESHSDFGA